MLCFRNFSLYKSCLKQIYRGSDYMHAKFPTVYLIIFDRQHEWRFSRYMLNCFYGIFVAFIFWEFIFADLGLQTDVLYCSLIIFIIVLGLGYTFFKGFRCIVLLICLGFWGKSGRSFLRAITYALIISGPISNMALNGKETIRVFSCSAILTYNLTKTRFDLMTRPFVNAIVGMKNNMSTIKKSFNEIEAVVKPIAEEIEEPDINTNTTEDLIPPKRQTTVNDSLKTPEFYQNQYVQKIEKRCDVQLRKGEAKCKKAFAEAYEKCYEKLPSLINAMFCWPMKITIVCNLKLYVFGRNICDPTQAIDGHLGDNYYHLKDTKNKFVGNLSSVKLSYKMISPKDVPGVQSVDETRKQLTGEFSRKKSIFDRCMKFVKKILAFIFVKVIINAVRYHSQYVSNIEADNIYVTEYFKKIDRRRKETDKRSLLPLKKIESREIIDPTSYRQSKSEGKGMFVHILKVALEMITALLFLLVDHIIYELLDIVRSNARIEYYQEGEHTLNIHVNGTGIVANLIRATLNGFITKETIHVKLSNEQCLPRPHQLTIFFYTKMALVYAFIVFLICNERIVFRLRHVICSYFYRKQEKRRVLHLYNKLLKRRKQIFVMMEEVVRDEVEKHRIQRRLKFLVILRLKYPLCFSWLKLFKISRRSCPVCGEPEPKKGDPNRPNNFAKCKTKGCYFVFCEECWNDANGRCLACSVKKTKSLSQITEDNF